MTMIDLREDRGPGAARNVAREAASGKYVLFLDSDDSIRSGAIARFVPLRPRLRPKSLLFGWTRSMRMKGYRGSWSGYMLKPLRESTRSGAL